MDKWQKINLGIIAIVIIVIAACLLAGCNAEQVRQTQEAVHQIAENTRQNQLDSMFLAMELQKVSPDPNALTAVSTRIMVRNGIITESEAAILNQMASDSVTFVDDFRTVFAENAGLIAAGGTLGYVGLALSLIGLLKKKKV